MGFQADFTAIDFETANRRRDSACQLAAVVVRQGEIVDERMWMIRPDPFFFSPGNIRIHGIYPEDVRDASTFGELWDEISDVVVGDCLIAHNASFDLGVLLGCLERHQLPVPNLHFSCTRLIARQTWPDRRRYGLKPLSDWLGVQFKHHDALEDSRACAKVLLASGIATNANTIEDLEQKLRIVRGKAGDWGIKQAARRTSGKRKVAGRRPEPQVIKRTLRRGSRASMTFPESRSEPSQATRPFNPFEPDSVVTEQSPGYVDQTAPIDWQRLAVRVEFIQPLKGKRVLICGKLNSLSDLQVIDITRRSGGTHQAEPDEHTNMIVIGAEEVDRVRIDEIIGQLSAEILTESEFLSVLGV